MLKVDQSPRLRPLDQKHWYQNNSISIWHFYVNFQNRIFLGLKTNKVKDISIKCNTNADTGVMPIVL